ncbi:hypothetical protein HMPREF0262_02609 [Clostridium sp. ATCC 29733]|nr:hypothetical protein HMPREF0262_02609 [Clostridium sp. ATCC 29733]
MVPFCWRAGQFPCSPVWGGGRKGARHPLGLTPHPHLAARRQSRQMPTKRAPTRPVSALCEGGAAAPAHIPFSVRTWLIADTSIAQL